MRKPRAFANGSTGRIVMVLLTVVGLASTATAQEPGMPGRLAIEAIDSGFVVTPTIKLTGVDDGLGTLTGMTAGWMTDRRLLIGAAGYWLTGGGGDVDMAYGGGVVEWFSNPGSRVDVSVGSLVGFGSATLDTVVDLDSSVGLFSRGRFTRYGRPSLPDSVIVRSREVFFTAEPQATLVLNATQWLRLGVGAGYRLVGSADGFEDRLHGKLRRSVRPPMIETRIKRGRTRSINS